MQVVTDAPATMVVVVADPDRLSRRKARKLAYQFRGGKRAARYRDYLANVPGAFWVRGRRLIRLPAVGKQTVTTIHSKDAAKSIRALLRQGSRRVISYEDPPEHLISAVVLTPPVGSE